MTARRIAIDAARSAARTGGKDAGWPVGLEDAQQGPLRLLLDYDGTLVPIERSPELAAPDADLLALLDDLARSPRLTVDIVSGRPRETLEAWCGRLPVALWAEHGFWHRADRAAAWRSAAHVDPNWMKDIAPVLKRFTTDTPGSQVEIKSASFAWHYRQVRPGLATRQARALRQLLTEMLRGQPFDVLDGKKVIEVRARGVSKALVAQRVRDQLDSDTRVLAMGDDRTDEDLFRALPESSLTIAVGRQPTAARFRVDDHRSVRHFLRRLIETPPRA